ncbi:hypothetical protein [Enterococcus faecalis]|uniref:hypothetical protein n=1 Tax=Enterococcus faecalis TaxID=1351 RepID=UPI0015E44F7B|nr:hypothetical protein [Enterococcus faecalis]
MKYPIKKTVYSILFFSFVLLIFTLIIGDSFSLMSYLFIVGSYSLSFVVFTLKRGAENE